MLAIRPPLPGDRPRRRRRRRRSARHPRRCLPRPGGSGGAYRDIEALGARCPGVLPLQQVLAVRVLAAGGGSPPFEGFIEEFNPSRGSLSGGRVDEDEDPQEDFLALGALIEEEGGQSTDYRFDEGHLHDLAGAVLDVVDPHGVDRPAGEGPTRSTCTMSQDARDALPPPAGGERRYKAPRSGHCGYPGGPGSGRSSTSWSRRANSNPITSSFSSTKTPFLPLYSV
jgi:hypothetical protein